MSHHPSLKTNATGVGLNRDSIPDVLQQQQLDRHLKSLHAIRSRLFEELTEELATGYETTNGTMQLIVSCGQDGDFIPEIGMISPVATSGAPLAFPSASVIAEVAFVCCPRQVRHKSVEGHSSDGK